MERDTILVKTDKGREEIETRRHGLSMALRRVLIVVDGRTSVGEFLDRAPFGQVGAALEQLRREGYVAPAAEVARAPTAPAAAVAVAGAGSGRAALVALARTLLGGAGARVVKRLEDAADTPEALLEAVQGCHKLIRLTIDEAKAEQFLQRAKELISK